MLGAGVLFFPPPRLAPPEDRKAFTVKGRPVVPFKTSPTAAFEVKSSKTQEVVVIGSQLSNKIGVETEQPMIALTSLQNRPRRSLRCGA